MRIIIRLSFLAVIVTTILMAQLSSAYAARARYIPVVACDKVTDDCCETIPACCAAVKDRNVPPSILDDEAAEDDEAIEADADVAPTPIIPAPQKISKPESSVVPPKPDVLTTAPPVKPTLATSAEKPVDPLSGLELDDEEEDLEPTGTQPIDIGIDEEEEEDDTADFSGFTKPVTPLPMEEEDDLTDEEDELFASPVEAPKAAAAPPAAAPKVADPKAAAPAVDPKKAPVVTVDDEEEDDEDGEFILSGLDFD